MLELLRNLNNTLDRLTVDSRIVECLSRPSREMSQLTQSGKSEDPNEYPHSKESSQEVKTNKNF